MNNENGTSPVKRRGKKLTVAELKRRKEIKRKKKIKKVFKSIFLVILLLVLGAVAYGFVFLSSLKTDNLVGGVKPHKGDSINVLLLGMDMGDLDQPDNRSLKRTDTMMVVNYNPQTEKTHIVSIPRDTKVQIDAYLENGQYRKYWKMNNAYALGGEEEVIAQVESILELNVNYLVKIDYNAFRSLIDAIGGVEMYIERDMYYDDDAQDLHINFTAGETVLLKGQEAENFFRWRKNNDGTGLENGDMGRIENQQKFMKALLKKCLSPSIITKVPAILNAVSENIETNMPAKQMISLGMKILAQDSSDIVMTTLQGVDEVLYGEDFIYVDRDMNIDLINSLNTNRFIAPTVDREKMKVMILNATSTNGLAGSLQDELYNLGYIDIEVGNYAPTDKSVINTKNDNVFETLENDTGIGKRGKSIQSEYADYDAVIVLGKDYNVFGQ